MRKILCIILVLFMMTACSEEETTATEIISDSESDTQEEIEMNLKMKISDNEVEVIWEDNESVDALKQLVKDEALIVEMSMYGGFEQVGSLGNSLPRNDTQTVTEAGDIVLYSGNQIVVFYGSNSWAYTRLGHVELEQKEIEELLGKGDVEITIGNTEPPEEGETDDNTK